MIGRRVSGQIGEENLADFRRQGHFSGNGHRIEHGNRKRLDSRTSASTQPGKINSTSHRIWKKNQKKNIKRRRRRTKR